MVERVLNSTCTICKITRTPKYKVNQNDKLDCHVNLVNMSLFCSASQTIANQIKVEFYLIIYVPEIDWILNTVFFGIFLL